MLNKLLILILLIVTNVSSASVFELPLNGDKVVGSIKVIRSEKNDNIFEISRKYHVAINEVYDANPDLPRTKTLPKGTQVKLPDRYILPGNIREGIVINLSELRLYYYFPNKPYVFTVPIGIGRVGWQTPVGTTTVIDKRENPTWTPPLAVRKEAEKNGVFLPEKIPPGPTNPLGKHMIRLGWRSYLIHSTNLPDEVGERVTAGCIRLYPEDMADLFDLVPIGTKVTVVDLPIKTARQGNHFLVEIHKPLAERGNFNENDSIDLIEEMTEIVNNRPVQVKWHEIKKCIAQYTGVPTIVGSFDVES